MKLANALADRSALQKRIADLTRRLNNNAKVQAGEVPSEDPEYLLKEIDESLISLEKLIAKINAVNSTTYIDGVSLTDLLAKRDCLRQRISIMRSFLNNASDRISRYSKTEIVIQSTVPVSILQKNVDDYSKQLREIEEIIQEANWTTEV